MSDESNQDQQSTVEEETKQVNAPVVEDTPVEEKSSNIDASETTDAKLDTKITEETAVPEPENGTDETVAPTKEEPTDSAKPEDSVVKSSEDHTESASDNKEPSDEKSVKAETSTKAEEPEESTKSKGTNGSEKQNGSSTEESLAPLPTGTVVLAKVKGFPAWPGIIIGDDLIPEDVLAVKPKSARRRKSANGDFDTTIYGVRFFIDISHFWASRDDLQLLTPKIANEFISKQKAKKESKLIKAYKIAADPPDLATLAAEIEAAKREDEEMLDAEEAPPKAKATKTRARSASKAKAKGDIFDPDNDLEMEDSSTPKKTTRRTTTRSTPAKRKPNATDGQDGAPTPRKRGKTTEQSSSTAAATETEKAGTPVSVVADEEMSSESPAQNSSPSATGSTNATTTSKDLKELISQRTKILRSIRHRLQRGFLMDKPTSEDLPDLSRYITRLEEIPDLEVSIMRATKIKKVLTAISRIEQIPEEETYKFKDRIAKILDVWNRNEQTTVPTTGTTADPVTRSGAEADGNAPPPAST